jgi:hypothetical protein
MTEEKLMDNRHLQEEAANILNQHIIFLEQFEQIDTNSIEVTSFLLKSLANILRPLPGVLLSDDFEANKLCLFETYNLISELKYNLEFLFQEETLFGRAVLDYANLYPMTYATDLKDWWQATQQVTLQEGKQTIEEDNFNF